MVVAIPKPGDESIRSGDIISRLDELHAALQLQEDAAEIMAWMDQYEVEYLALQSVSSQAERLGDWGYGERLVRRDAWTEHYKQMQLEAISPRPVVIDWLETAIAVARPENQVVVDWTATANAAAEDYAEVEFGAVTYLILP
jgi:hypothetical protein